MIRIANRRLGRRDSGSALVAAVGVSVIGMALATLVVTQTIIVNNDTGRDRARTLQVHAAEAALDTSLAELAAGSPCEIGPLEVGNGVDEMTVAGGGGYYDAAGNLLTTCVSGQIAGNPVEAQVTAHATALKEFQGLEPTRSFEVELKLEPVEVSGAGSTIFSGNGISTGAGFTVEPADPDAPAGVWIDSGNYTCNTNVVIRGDLIVATGTTSFQNSSCQVTGNVWSKGNFSTCCSPNSSIPWAIGGDLTVRSGNVTFSNPTKIGGNIRASGTLPGANTNQWKNSTIGGTVCGSNRTPCTSFPEFEPRGLPEIGYFPDDWDGFTVRSKQDFGNSVLSSWGFTSSNWQYGTLRQNFGISPSSQTPNCQIPAYMSSTAVNLPSSPGIYDLRGCGNGFDANGGVLTLNINADTAFFAKQFQASNGLIIKSGDGQPHQVWLIVPDAVAGNGARAGNGAGACATVSGIGTYCPDPGSISFSSNALQVQSPITIFLYTPGAINFPNTSTTRGQMYAGSVTVGAGNGKFQYVGIGVPGVNLGSESSTSGGFTVEMVSKREVRD